MSYQVLARKWRPRRFSELVGQGHVVRALTNALDSNRLHHAFLFTGTRGVGKTTIARILAKSLNCEQGVSANPCGTCRTCTEVDEGRFVDLIEVDAASRTKVDDTRELLDNVQYAPTRGRYKVYLVDEVHMLSGHSFNALLKTLEEPPPHVKFLLATTDPQKLPVTILSRCLQFNLKRLEPQQITAQLQTVLGTENIAFDTPALGLLAEAADGSMRDALSLLDQAIAFGGGAVRETEVRDMLGTIDQGLTERLLDALGDHDAPAALTALAEAAQHSLDYDAALRALLLDLHRIALAQLAPTTLAGDDAARVQRHAARLAPEDVQLYYQIGVVGRRDLPLAPDPRTGLEMVLLRMIAFRPAEEVQSRVETNRSERGVVPARPLPAPTDAPPAKLPVADAPDKAGAWSALVARLGLAGLVRELANNCALESATDDVMQVVLDPAFAHILSKERVAALNEAVNTHLGRPVRIDIRVGTPQAETPAQERHRRNEERQRAAVDTITNDPTVRALQEQFNARINPGSIRPKP